MNKIAFTAAPFFALALAACATTAEPEPVVVEQEQREEAAPRPTINTVTVDGRSVRTLADEAAAQMIAARARSSAARGFEGDNKGNACFQDPVFLGVAGGELSVDGGRREEFWNYSVCGEAYEVPVVVTKTSSGAVEFIVGSGREAR